MGALISIEKEVLSQVGRAKYSKGYCYIPEDSGSPSILLLKPKGGIKHWYDIPDMKKFRTTDVARAIYALLHETNKNRTCILVETEEIGRIAFYSGDSIILIFRKLCEIDEFLLVNK